MGTRADFYIGIDQDAEWIGSIAWDGYPETVGDLFSHVHSKDVFRSRVAEFLSDRNDATLPDDGWPWPWDDSRLTDYSYCFHDGQVWLCCFGGAWTPFSEREGESPHTKCVICDFPDMSDIKNVTLGPRSGLIVLR